MSIPTKEHIKSGVVSENPSVPKDITLRDYFAVEAMAALIIKSPLILSDVESGCKNLDRNVAGAYAYADAMLKAREVK